MSDVFEDEFVPNIEGHQYHAKWVRANPGEATKWQMYRDACLAYDGEGSAPVPPLLATKYGKALVAAGKLDVSVTDLGAEWDPPVVEPPPPTGTENPLGYLRLGNLVLQSNPTYYGLRIQSRTALETRPNPSLIYVHPWQCHQSDDRNGISAPTARASGWLLHNSSGNEIFLSAYGTYLADVGNAAYRTAWKNAIVSRCATYGYHGVFMDDCLTYNNAQAPSYSTLYPNNAAIRAAQLSWQVYMAPILGAANLKIAVNANASGEPSGVDNDFSETNAWWTDLAPHVDYLLLEYWMNTAQAPGPSPDPDDLRLSGSAAWYNNWESVFALMDVAYNGGAAPIGLASGTTTRRQGYCFASFLLGFDSNIGGVAIWAPEPRYTSGTDPWNAIHDEVRALGNPTTSAHTKSGNTYTRTYQNGNVLVDPVAGTWQIGSLSG